MNKNKKNFIYKNKIILTNGSSLQIPSIKYIKNYQLNFKVFYIPKINKNQISDLNTTKRNFIHKII